MAATINTAFINQFKDTLHLLLEQRGSKLRGVFPVEMANGEKHFFDRLGSFNATEVTSRLQVTNLQDPAHSRRMATVRRYEASTSLDDIDKLKMLIDPTSKYSIQLANTHGKNYDVTVIDAILGAAATGQDGSGSQAFNASNQIAHGSAGFTVDKFNQALRILQSYEVDIQQDELVLIINARGLEDLMGDSNNRFTSFDFMNSKPLADGSIPKFRGVEIIHSERAPDETADTTFRALLVTKDSVNVAMSKDLEVKTAERPDLNFATQISTYMMFGAVRIEENRCIDILFQ